MGRGGGAGFSGSFGTVHEARWYGTRLAVKVIPRERAPCGGMIPSIDGDGDELPALASSIVNEIHVFAKLAECAHPHIVAFVGACSFGNEVCLCTELVPMGSLCDFLHNSSRRYALSLSLPLSFFGVSVTFLRTPSLSLPLFCSLFSPW